jgi:hypothetical protein
MYAQKRNCIIYASTYNIYTKTCLKKKMKNIKWKAGLKNEAFSPDFVVSVGQPGLGTRGPFSTSVHYVYEHLMDYFY